jgi:hypothetical protein
MFGDNFRFFFIEPAELGTGVGIGAQQFIKLCMYGECIAMARTLNEQRHKPDNQSSDCIEVEGAPLKDDPDQGVQQNDGKGGGVRCGLANTGGPAPGGGAL